MSGSVTADDARSGEATPEADYGSGPRTVIAVGRGGRGSRVQETGAGNAEVGRAAEAEIQLVMNLAVDREPERRVAGAGILEIELESQRAARHRDPAGHDGVEHTVERGGVVIDDPVPDVAVTAQQAPTR
jgi:hypothetical protein